MLYVSVSMILEISPFAAFLATRTFRSSQVATRVFWMPFAIMRTAANTNTTSVIPEIVMAVVKRRVKRLLTVYLSGIFMALCPTV